MNSFLPHSIPPTKQPSPPLSSDLPRSKKFGLYVLIGVSLITVALVFRSYWNYHLLKTTGKYTVGTTKGIKHAGHGVQQVYYEYKVGSSVLKHERDLVEGVEVYGGKYLVVYVPSNPTAATILFDHPVTDADTGRDWGAAPIDPESIDFWNY